MCPQAIPVVMKFLPAITAVAGTVTALSNNRRQDRDRGTQQAFATPPATRVARAGSAGLGDEQIKKDDEPVATTLTAAQKAMAKRKSDGLKSFSAAKYTGPSLQLPSTPSGGYNV